MASTLPAPVTRRTGSLNLRRTGSLIVVGAVAAAVAGCAGGVPNRLDFSDTEKVKVTEIVVTGGSGDVVVRTAAIAETRIKRVVRYRNGEPGQTYRLDGTVLHVDTDCGDHCNVSYDIEAPTGVAVTGTLGSGDVALTNVAATDLLVNSGDVRVTGATGAVKLETHSGDIDVRDVHGVTQLTANSGNITGTNLGGAALAADVTSGDIDLQVEQARPGDREVDQRGRVAAGSRRQLPGQGLGELGRQGRHRAERPGRHEPARRPRQQRRRDDRARLTQSRGPASDAAPGTADGSSTLVSAGASCRRDSATNGSASADNPAEIRYDAG